MQSTAKTPQEYIDSLPEDRKTAMEKLRKTLIKNLPKGFEETMGYGMLCFVVPKSIYPAGYHCDPKLPLGFISIASQKNFIALYHMGIYCNPKLLEWFISEYPKHSKLKLDMGKSCIRFKKTTEIPYELISQLATKVSVKEWVSWYENALNRNN